MIKTLLKKIYSKLPAWLILSTKLKKYIHHKRIPKNVEIFTIKNTAIKLHSDPSPIITKAFWLGKSGYEKNELNFYIDICKKVNSVCEIGGNIGYFTVFGASAIKSKNYKVYEPVPYNFDLLKKNLEINNLFFVNCINSAIVGDKNSKVIKIYIPKAEKYNAATGAFIEGAEAIDRETTNSFEISAINAAEAVRGFELIKIDVEGAEYEILSNAEKELVKSQSIIFVEMRRKTNNLRKWITSFALKYDYKLYVLSDFDGKLHKVEKNLIPNISLQDTYGTRDIIMCPVSKLSIICKN